MTLKELETQLLALTAIEQAEALQFLTHTFNGTEGINKTPGVCGGNACVGNTRIPVWLLVSFRRQGSSEAELLNFYPQLSAADLVNAWAYAAAYPEELEDAIHKNEAA